MSPANARTNWVTSSADGNRLVALVSTGAVHVSEDAGVTWTRRGSQLLGGVTSSADANRLVGWVYDGFIYTSTDFGLTWTERAPRQLWRHVASSADGTKLVASTFDPGGNLFLSSDAGATWTQHAGTFDFGIVAMSADATKLVEIGSAGVHTSVDSGMTWTPRVLPGTPHILSGVASSADGTKLVIVTFDERMPGRVYTSTGPVR